MFWVLLTALVVAEAAKLDNSYLPPPPNAKDAGGSDGALEVPLEPPYIDQYSSSNQLPSSYAKSVGGHQHSVPAGQTHHHASAGQPTGRRQPGKTNPKVLENEDEIVVPAAEKGRFISGSYSYTGPDNVLVTVTYKANDRNGRKEVKAAFADDSDSDSYEDEVEDQDEEDVEDGRALEEDESSEEDVAVPTPSSLPSELARAFDFHRNKHLNQEGKTGNRPKKPIRKQHKKKGQQEGEENGYGQKTGPQHQHQHQQKPGYQYGRPAAAAAPPANSGLYGAPTIHQGYSYPKQS